MGLANKYLCLDQPLRIVPGRFLSLTALSKSTAIAVDDAARTLLLQACSNGRARSWPRTRSRRTSIDPFGPKDAAAGVAAPAPSPHLSYLMIRSPYWFAPTAELRLFYVQYRSKTSF